MITYLEPQIKGELFIRDRVIAQSEPQIMGSHLTTANELALKLDTEDVQYGLFNIVYKLPHDCSEWERPLTIVSHADGEGFTGAETDRSQWFSLKS